jgi:hypothetical protein
MVVAYYLSTCPNFLSFGAALLLFGCLDMLGGIVAGGFIKTLF